MIKLVYIIIILMLLLPVNIQAADKWSTQDIVFETAYQILHFIDWRQTRYIAKSPSSSRKIVDFVDWEKKKYVFKYPKAYSEKNPILGRHPSVFTVDKYFLITAVLHPVVTHYLPKKYRVWWQGITIAISGGFVGYNYSIGIKMDF